MHDRWYLDKKSTEEEENMHIVEAAADIIRRDIRSLVFDIKIYPAMESLDSGQLPETLKTFLNRVIQGEVVERKNTAIREAIMSACHPHSYISPTLLGIGVHIHRHHASRQLVDIPSSLSFSASYKEVKMYEFSALEHNRANTGGSKKGYIQYAFDNADFNIRTLTGHGTFRSMGGLQGINIRELATVSDATARSVKNTIAADVLWWSARCFVASIGFIISGSGIEELWMPVYAKSSVTHMISGHAFSRAVRAQLLTSQALLTMILGMENLFGVYQEELHKLFLEVSTDEKMIPDAVESPVLGRFIRAERSGDWELHLQCVRSMLPYLHAAGHIHYAKSAHLYVQQMKELPSRMPPHEYNKFTSEGFFTVQRKNEIWGGVWTDLSIEQDLKRALKTKGGLTRGDSRRIRDARDVAVLLSWLKEHSPWDVDCLQSLAPGVVGDDSINCDQAEYVGLGAIKRIIGSNFSEVKLTQKNRVKPLSAVARSILIRDDVVELFSYTTPEENSTNDPRRIVIAGGHLLHALSTKSQEHFRRGSKRTSAEIIFNMNTSASTTQADFLSNHHKKERLITLLSHHFETAGIEACNSEGDADTLITTSASLGKGKKKAWKILQFVIALYGRINVNSLDELIVIQYTRSIAKQPVTAAFELAALPPTSAACAEHSLWTYYQLTGWKLAGEFLVPVLTSRTPAPESLLRLVSCDCKTDCGYRRECRRAGLACSTMCGHCRGGSCMNIKIQVFHGSDDEDDPEEATL
ncbi:hypothetical protein PR048_027031 [Dryococelus australis]|uniref:Tesmin/TSO1-like CXC domain-containing protein n=1 Tax=Dryococelus australis TaxID=614101 RepID=A0ABQ9GG36_9NEOP|nr:hypothetical protein PR048_027031 [Dryococelus australis]